MIEQLYETQKERVTDIVREIESGDGIEYGHKVKSHIETYSEGKSIVKRAAKMQSRGKVSNKIRL